MAGRLTNEGIFRWNQQANGPAVFGVRVSRQSLRRDMYYGGPGRIEGITDFDGVPGPARIHLQDRISMLLVRSTRSNAAGEYTLPHLRTDMDFLITAIDERNQDNAVVLDRVRAGGA